MAVRTRLHMAVSWRFETAVPRRFGMAARVAVTAPPPGFLETSQWPMRWAHGLAGSPRTWVTLAGSIRRHQPTHRRGSRSGSGHGAHLDQASRDMCSLCKQRGHWRVCRPTLSFNANQAYASGAYYDDSGQNNGFYSAPSTNNDNVQVMSGKGRSDTYIDVSARGLTVSSLLDTGCERNICPLRLCRNAKISPNKS